MRTLIIVLVAAIIASCTGISTISPDETTYDFSKVDDFLNKNQSDYNGQVIVLVSQNGKLIYQKSIGLSAESIRPIASASKWLSAAVIMSLVDENKITLDDSVGKYLPIFTRNGKGQITVRQLFSHTAGFDGDSPQNYEYRRLFTLAEAVDSIALYTPLVYSPGTAFSYGGTGMHIAGRIAEIVSGKSWQQLFNEKIAKPCGITATYGSISNPMIAGGARTSAADYLKFLEMILSKGMSNGKRVLSENSVSLMLSDQTRSAEIKKTPYPNNPFSPYSNTSVRYGMGNWLDVVDEQGTVLESSSPGLFGTHPWQDSKNKIAGIIFTQTTPRKSTLTSLEIRKLIRDCVKR